MNKLWQELSERIRGEMSDLDRLVQRVLATWLHAQGISVDQDVYLESIALNLHGFYSGLERLFELIARHVDGELPNGKTWHHNLLQQMATDIEDFRPAVIGLGTAENLDELRRFRHLVRNVYTFNLVPEKMQGLIDLLPQTWTQLKAELLAFATFLEILAQAK